MRKTNRFFFGFFVFAAGCISLWQTALADYYLIRTITHNEWDACKKTKDPFEVGAYIFQRGDKIPRLTGHCVETSELRPTFLLVPQELKEHYLTLAEGEIAIANVRGIDGFYFAVFNPQNATRAVLQITNRTFPLIGKRDGHIQIRIDFNAPIRLVPQTKATRGLEPKDINHLVFSVHGVSDFVGQLDLLTALMNDSWDGSFLTVLSTFTPLYMMDQNYIVSKQYQQTLKQYDLNLTGDECGRYITTYVGVSERVKYSRYYHLTLNNCVTNQLKVMSKALKSRAHKIKVPRYSDPATVLPLLIENQLMESESWSKLKEYDQEFPALLRQAELLHERL